ncbi:MAG: DUF3276 family protein [Bacteroidales bacterium]|nr:DUF3276 family protein [Bacteroidales bacterium]
MNEQVKGKTESDMLFSKAVKAGKRIYYIDVKQDRHGESYLSITESKRVKEGTEESRPVFEKHKIFLYREDIEKFMNAMEAAIQFTQENCGELSRNFGSSSHNDFYSEGQISNSSASDPEDDEEDLLHKSASDFRLDIDF